MKQEKQDGHAEGNRVIQYNTIKVRLCPTPEQEELFQKTFGCCRYIWNQMLSDHERFYEETDAHFIPTPAKYKKGAPFLKEVDNQALTQEYNRLSQAFRNFFEIRRRSAIQSSSGKRTTGTASLPVTSSSGAAPPFMPPGTRSA